MIPVISRSYVYLAMTSNSPSTEQRTPSTWWPGLFQFSPNWDQARRLHVSKRYCCRGPPTTNWGLGLGASCVAGFRFKILSFGFQIWSSYLASTHAVVANCRFSGVRTSGLWKLDVGLWGRSASQTIYSSWQVHVLRMTLLRSLAPVYRSLSAGVLRARDFFSKASEE